MEKVKKSRPWMETAIILAAIGIMYSALKTEIGAVRTEMNAGQKILETEIKNINSRIDSVISRIDGLERILSRQDTEIQATDKKIDDLKNSLLSKSK